jgi:hypothetical protein
MKGQFLLAAAAILLLDPWSPPATAKVADAAWARCIWDSDPRGAAAWLAMPVPAWSTLVTARESLLGYRLAALCDDTRADPKKPNRMPPFKAMASALKKAKPKGALPDAVSGPPAVLLCEIRVAGSGFVHHYQIVRRGQMGESVAFEQHMTLANGMTVKLPSGLRAMPAGETSKTCRRIGPGGELSDA